MKKISMTALCFAASFALAGVAYGRDESCRYDGTSYSAGATVCQSGTQYRCDGGEWASLKTACPPSKTDLKSCEFSGESYSSGSASCQAGTQYRCIDGSWKNLAVACAPTELEAASAPAPVRTCMLDGTTVASASTVCKSGVTFLCDNGDWRNLGTACR